MTSNRVLVECFNGHPNTIDVAELNMHQSRCCAVCDQPLRYPLSQIIEEAFGDAVAFRPTGWRENEPAYRLPTAEEARDRLLKAIAEHGYLTRASGASPVSKRVERLETGDNHKLDTDAQVFFYEQDFYVLSNFSAFNLRWYGWTFPTSEHAYHWSRFALGWDLNDADGALAAPICALIQNAPSAHEAFKLAQEHKALQHPNWNVDKVGVMHQILRNKASQHEYVRRKLLATGDRELVEDSWRDDYWGWGPNRDGQNMLGKLWMEVRADLRQALQGGRS